MRRFLTPALAFVLALAMGGLAFAQGSQSGTLTGTVYSPDHAALPGVSVSIHSPALLGAREAVTDVNGSYIFKALPPGEYTIAFDLSGFSRLEKKVVLALGATMPADATMNLATVQETVTVTTEAPSPLTTTQVGANIKQDVVDTLATGRTIQGVATLAPGLTTNTPNAGQLTIAGSFAYDNVFLLDGVDINDNLFGSANNLFIEDAIEETQIMTSGISAEFGRFSGGVVNAVTKRGGNKFSGSLRANFTNPAWRDETPIEKTQGINRLDKLSKFYEATLGGPIIKDRVWFFAAGRKLNADTQLTLPETNLPFTQVQDQKRGEVKLTAAITPNHTLQVTGTKVWDTIHRLPFQVDMDPIHDAYDGQQPINLFVANYNGVLRSNLFVEAQFSKKHFGFVNSGGTSTNIIDSPYLAQAAFLAYNAPYFDATDPEDRNNRQMSVALSYFLSTASLGKHDIKVGFENYRSTRTGGNSQSSTGYVFYTDYATDAAGKPLFDSNGYIVPVFTPGVSQLQNWIATRGAQIDLTTNSAYVNDRWTLNNHWSFNLGARTEWAKGVATGNIQPVSTAARIVPRLGASFDVKGDGKFKLDATYSHYAGKYSETQFAQNTPVGNPDAVYSLYTGPAGQGRGFAPGINPANYSEIIGGVFALGNVFYDKNIKSPVTKEWTAAAGTQIGSKGYLKAIYTHRNVTNFVQQFVTTANGTTHIQQHGIDFGDFSNRLWSNTNDGVRKYDGIQFQTAYRLTDRWNFAGNYTYQIKNEGNQEGEGTNTPGAPSLFSGFYPELFTEARNFPIGNLNGYQKHRARAWMTYDLGLGKAGSLNAGLLWRFDSGQAFSIRSTAALSSVQQAIGAALYPDLPSSQPLFYAPGRGSENYENASLFDLALTYNLKVWKSASPYVKGEVRNMLNSTPLISYNITVSPDPNSPRDALGLRTGFVKGSRFGQATSSSNYPFPREYLLTVGFRF